MKLTLVDQEGKFHEFEPAVVPRIGCEKGVQSVDPQDAARLFNQSPSDFNMISRPLDILLGHVRPSIFPVADKLVGKSQLYKSAFSKGWLVVSADEAAGDMEGVYSPEETLSEREVIVAKRS